MNQINLLQKLTPVGFAAFGVVTVTSISVVPAQAFTLGIHTLEWDNGTSSFVEEAAPIFENNLGNSLDNPAPVGGDFDVTFSPESLGGLAAVFIATNDFGEFFNPPEFVPVDPSFATGTFEIISEAIDINGVLEAEFELVESGSPLIFAFDVADTPSNFADDVIATLSPGTKFLGELLANGAVEFELEQGEWVFAIPSDPGVGTEAASSEFEFGQTAFSPGGGYQAEGDVVVSARAPEPTTILGLLTVGSLGLGFKRKKQL